MKIIQSQDGTVIKMYSNAKECPQNRYSELQKYLALDAGIGSDIESICLRTDRIAAYIDEGKIKDALIENNNLKLACLAVLNGISYVSIAFACLVAEIGGQVAKDVSYEGLLSTANEISKLELSQHEIEDAVEEIKKKS